MRYSYCKASSYLLSLFLETFAVLTAKLLQAKIKWQFRVFCSFTSFSSIKMIIESCFRVVLGGSNFRFKATTICVKASAPFRRINPYIDH